jgi:chromosomal replication initiator protein
MITIASIKAAVAHRYGLHVADLVSPDKHRRVAHPRQFAMCMAKHLTHHSRSEIGRRFGGRDHTTVLYADRVVIQRLRQDPALRDDMRAIRQAVAGAR